MRIIYPEAPVTFTRILLCHVELHSIYPGLRCSVAMRLGIFCGRFLVLLRLWIRT